MKFKISIVVFLVGFGVFAQKTTTIFTKTAQQHSEKLFYEEVFKNPALMPCFGDEKHSKITVNFGQKEDVVYQIQQPNKTTKTQFLATSFFPLDSTKTLWGEASYTTKNSKNIRWNESVDYNLIAPYITADSIGGKLKTELYSFLGGYAKKYRKTDIGIELNYKANLSSRNVDPRPKIVSSNLNLKFGVNFKQLPVDIGLYAKGQKYTQSNQLIFFSEISNPSVYHLNGLGYFNKILKGTKNMATYNGLGFGFGTEITTKQKDVIVTFDYKNFNLEKLILENNNGVEIANLKSNDITTNITKLFPAKKHTFGVKFSYKNISKKGLEPILSSRSGSGLIVLKQNENYKFKNDIFGLSGLFFTENNQQLIKISPYVNYQKYREDYSLITSFRYFDYAKGGVKTTYLYKIDPKNIFVIMADVNYRKTLKNKYLLRNDSEVSIVEMLQHNTNVLSKNVAKININLEYVCSLNAKLNVVFGLENNISVYGNQLNNLYNFSAGISF